MNVLQLKKKIGSYIQNISSLSLQSTSGQMKKLQPVKITYDQGLVSTMITLKKEINIVLRQTHIDYTKLCMHYFDSNLF